MKKLGFYKIYEDVPDPIVATEESACFDLHAWFTEDQQVTLFNPQNKKLYTRPAAKYGAISLTLHPYQRLMVPTGIKLDIPSGHCVKVYSRSGLAAKEGVRLFNSVGIIDSDYTDELFLLMENTADNAKIIRRGDRVAQAMLCKLEKYSISEVADEPSTKTDRNGGFGSTDETTEN